MRLHSKLLIAVFLGSVGHQVLADRLAELPSAWQQQLKSVAQVDVSPLKADEQDAISEARARIDRLLQTAEADREQLASEFGRLGNLYLAHDLFTSADACYQNAMRLAPDYFPWAYYSAYLAQEDGNLPLALARFQHALSLDPDYPPARYRLAQIYLDLNRLDEASAGFQSLLDEPAFEAAAHNGLGQVLVTRQQYEKAVEHFTRALALAPEATQLHYPLALALRAAGRTKLAKQHLKLYGKRELVIEDRLVDRLKALQNPASRHFVAAMTAVKRKNYANAANEFSTGLEFEPDNTAARTSYARVLFLAGDKNKARTQLEHVLAQAPENSLATFLLAILEDESGNIEKAMELYRRVIELDSSHAGANFYLGNHALNGQDYGRATRFYQTVIAQDEKNIPAHIFKLVAMMGSGATDKDLLAAARTIMDRAPNMFPVRRIQILLLALSDDPAVRNNERARTLAENMHKDHPYPVNLELLALANASAGNYSLATDQMREALAAEKKHKKSRNVTRMTENLLLLEQEKLPALGWHAEIRYMQPPPTKALASFRDYPDANPI